MIKYIFKNIKEEINLEEDEKILYLKNKIEINDFFDKILLTDNIILKEEKETLFFYSCLNSNSKEIFKIKSYFDSIDIAYNYYSLINDLYLNNIKYEDLNLEKWQEKYIKEIYKIHEIMLKKADSQKIVPRYLKYYNTNINQNYLEKFNKIVIINKMYTNKKELEILNSLKIDVEYHLYTNSKDYNKEKNLLEDITIEKNNENNIEAINVKDINSMLIYLTEYLSRFSESEKITINDLDSKAEYNDINENLLNWHKKNFLNKSKSYKLLNYVYNLENSIDYSNNKIELITLYFSILDKEFNEFFEVSREDIENIKNEIKGTKKYTKIDNYEFLKNILDKDINQICNDIAKKYDDEALEFLEAVTEINILDEFNLKKYIDSKKDMYKIILKYLDAKEKKLKLIEKKFEISKVDNEKSENYILLNAQSAMDFNVKEYILNSKQRKELGLLSTSDYKYVVYYDYIRKLYLSNNSKIIYIKNIDEDIDIKSIFASFFIKNNIEPKSVEYSTNDIIKHIRYINSDIKILEKDKDFLTKEDYILATKEDFENLRINGYNISTFMEDILSYMLVKSIKKSKGNEFIKIDNSSISNITIGNILHNIVEDALEKKITTIDELVEIKNKILIKYKDYINKEYYNIYDCLLFDRVLEDILKYILKMKKYDISVEDEIENIIDDVKVSFKVDILAKLNDKYNIIDIKSGTQKENIVYNYQLQAYKTFLEYFKGFNIDKISLYYPFDNNKEVIVNNKEFSIEVFRERLKTIKNMDKFEREINILDYDMKKIIREDKYYEE